MEWQSQLNTSDLGISIQSRDDGEWSDEENGSIFSALVSQCESDR